MRTVAERYKLTSPIARGGMGVVWQGSDLRLNRSVAVKLIYEDDLVAKNEATRRFYREARITARLRHPGVPVVYDFGSDGGELFMVMEYLDGHMVADLIAEQSPLPVSWAALIAAQVCAVLAAAHAADLIHRDIKPNNLVMCADATVKVIDFGVATALGAKEFSQITEAGQIPGTARYMAPELVDGAEASRSSDLYTVGCLLYELLTGSRPYASRDLMNEIHRSRREIPPPVERSDVPEELEELTLRLLAKSPEERPESALSVFESLLPLVKALPPLPGLINKDLSIDPVHMYAAVIQHVST
ncbi:serine/threonine-protein kinase [Streptosporangium lutulentum]|uniref:non-specific serine/threonine protein kinase n=1 Tax=Streptosporangium lutulentum TaxID=1461250 RepID=A0ABT9QSL3_9ACTN|nr:serine/threonine-protein kinase [Streptosporangium lutulentum]MDP9849745.1 non-specific serine/threonine protein kinase [Streptosporangium lutulentum]